MTPRRGTATALAGALLVALAACSSATPSASPADCPSAAPTAAEAAAISADADRAMVRTSLGTFSIELYPAAAPIASANFVALARCGFYAGITFHRVLAGFVIQAGDPQTRTNREPFDGLGTGGPGYQFEIEPVAEGYAYDQYVVAMANAGGTHTNGSQFFIDLVNLVGQLPPDYTIFGRVVEGTEVVDAIGQVAVNDQRLGVPLEPVIIEEIRVISL